MGDSIFSYESQGGNQGQNDQARYSNKDVLGQILIEVKGTNKMLREMRIYLYRLQQTVTSH